jgi:4-alpha-glucanotransferase
MDLFDQAKSLGILTEFIDGQGHRRVTSEAALRIIVDSFPARTPYRLVEGPVVVRSGQPGRTALLETAELPLQWEIDARPDAILIGVPPGRTIRWPKDLPIGTYRLRLKDAEGAIDDVPLIVAPERAYPGDFDRAWLLAVQLYSVRSARNWGMGDFTDLEGLIRLAAKLGADGVGLNPLHALFDDRPADCSPYSPNSRLFLNALYIDVENIPEYRASADEATITRLRQTSIVDYPTVAAEKWRALRAAFDKFNADGAAHRREDFETFRQERGALLRAFACFEVLRHCFKAPWWEWPEQWRQPDAATCAAFSEGVDRVEVEFVEFVQWTADRQLGSAKELARALGMKVGL